MLTYKISTYYNLKKVLKRSFSQLQQLLYIASLRTTSLSSTHSGPLKSSNKLWNKNTTFHGRVTQVCVDCGEHEGLKSDPTAETSGETGAL